MTISEGLHLRSNLKKKLGDLAARATSSVTYQSDKLPAFDFAEVTAQADRATSQLVDLEDRIARANAATTLPATWDTSQPRRSLTWAVRRLNQYKSEIAQCKALPCRAQEKTYEEERDYDAELSKYVIKRAEYTCKLPEARRAALLEDLQEKFDRLNAVVEHLDHVTVLPE